MRRYKLRFKDLNKTIMPRLLNKEDVCNILDIHVNTLNTYMKEGKLPYIKMDSSRRGNVRFKQEDVTQLINDNYIR